ncbi:FAD:protein FMN transferase [Aliidiomarina sp. Khilg15.8]
MRCFTRVMLLGLSVLLVAACGRGEEAGPHTLSGDIFGTFFEVSIGTEHADIDRDRIEKGVLARLNEVDRQMSTYRDDSVLNQLNKAPLHEPVVVDDALFEVLQRSEQIAEHTQGTFDHAIGSLVNLWGFGPDGQIEQRPDEDELQRLLAEVGYHFVILNEQEQSVMRTRDVFVDLSAIAKGYAVDKVSEYLHQEGLHNHLVNIGGDLVAQGQRGNDQRWRIGIEAPLDGAQMVRHILPLEDIAMVSSGDYRNYFEHEGRRYSHLIDPTTGEPIAHRLAAVTVMADNAADADAYATALMVMGEERGLAFANEQEIAALFIYRADEGFESVLSERFKRDHESRMTAPRVQ